MTEPASDYPDLFRHYIARSCEQSLANLPRPAERLSAAARERALHCLSYGLALPAAWPIARQLLLEIAPFMESGGFREGWSHYLVRGIACAQAVQDEAAEAELRWHLGVLDQLQASYEDACRELERSATLYERLGERGNQARALNRLAYATRRRRHFVQARELVEQVFALTTEGDPERAYSYLVLGSIALDCLAWPEAAAYFRQALTALGPEPDPRQRAWNLSNLGLALWHADQCPEAATCFREAIALYEETVDDPVNLAVSRMNLGLLFLKDRPDEALGLFREAEKTFRSAEDPLRLAKLRNNVGLACTDLQRWEEAAAAYQDSLRLWRQVGDPIGVSDTLDNQGLLLAAQGRYLEAQVSYDEALTELARIPGDPGYANLHHEVTVHRREAADRLTPRP